MYAWQEDRRASRACIKHFIAQAVERKQWAESVTDEWLTTRASAVSQEWVKELRANSIKHIARDSLEYARMRAWLGLDQGGWPWDRPAHRLWTELNPGAFRAAAL